MTVALVMIAKDEEKILARAIDSARELVDEIHVLDTGSTDGTVNVAESLGARVARAEWEGFGPGRTEALKLAQGTADWHLMLDADMTVEAHPNLAQWLTNDPDPDVGAWQVEIAEADIRYRLPLLIRDGIEASWEGATHEYLTGTGKQRPLLGLTVQHHCDSAGRADKHLRDLELLEPDYVKGDPRATYYLAQALKCLGHTEQAIVVYAERAQMGGWEEERWHAQYMAARLREDVPSLLEAWRARPHRHEPLLWASRVVAKQGIDDVLFLEQPGVME